MELYVWEKLPELYNGYDIDRTEQLCFSRDVNRNKVLKARIKDCNFVTLKDVKRPKKKLCTAFLHFNHILRFLGVISWCILNENLAEPYFSMHAYTNFN